VGFSPYFPGVLVLNPARASGASAFAGRDGEDKKKQADRPADEGFFLPNKNSGTFAHWAF
jgi:hypothetical protein